MAAVFANQGMSGTLFSNVNNIQSMMPEDQKNITLQSASVSPQLAGPAS